MGYSRVPVDNSGFIQINQAGIHADHTVLSSGMNGGLNLMGFGITDHGTYGRRYFHQFKSRAHGFILRNEQLL